MNRFSKKCWYLKTQTIYKPQFHSIGKRTLILKPVQLDFVKTISLSDDVYIAEGAWLMGGKSPEITLSVNRGTTIGHFSHIVATHSVTIEENVLIADKVFISDCTHSYDDISNPVIYQNIKDLKSVVIGEGSWLGENVCVCGAKVGKHCVIGANSVVVSDIPDYSVAVGSPAKVVKKYDFDKAEWIKVN